MPTHEKITDFGEKFWGARKDLWTARGLLFEDLSGASQTEIEKYVVKKNVLPKIDYQSLKDNGLSLNVIYFYKTIIDSLPSKPTYNNNKNPDQVVQDYISYLNLIKNDLLENVKNDDDINKYWNHIKELGLFSVNYYRVTVDEKYKGLIENKFLKAAQTNLYKIKNEVEKKNFLMSDKEIVEKQFRILYYDDEKVKFVTSLNNTEMLSIQVPGGKYFIHHLPSPKSEWKKDTYFILKNNRIISINNSTEIEANNKKDSFIEAELNKPKDESNINTTRKKAFIPNSLQNVKRVAEFEWNNKNYTPEDYLNIFKFRGGEFGNWENQTERQLNLNMAADAFNDLAIALEVDVKSISGDGKLGIAFGSRGRSKAAAHYEDSSKVINLTRMSGAGALGHEWGHFLDNMLSSTSTGYATENNL